MSDTDLTVGNQGTQISVPKKGFLQRPSEREPGSNISPEEYLKNKGLEDGSRQDLDLTVPKERVDRDLTDYDGKKESQNLQALKFWNKNIQKAFNAQPAKIKKLWLESFAIVEKGCERRIKDVQERFAPSQELADIVSTIEPILPELEKAGKTPAEYFKEWIETDKKLAKDPYLEVAKLCVIYNLSLASVQSTLPYAQDQLAREQEEGGKIRDLERKLSSLEHTIQEIQPPSSAEKDTEEAIKLADDFETFYSQVDKKGQPLYPDAHNHLDAIFAFIEQGYGLDEAYKEAMLSTMSDGSNEEEEIEYEGSRGEVGTNVKSPLSKYSKEYEDQFLNRAVQKIMSTKR
jgi:hypothetical protein